MSIKFICDQCSQVLKVHASKVGAKVKCPKCETKLTVPSEKKAADAVARYKKSVDESVGGDSDFDPFSQFAVYDDDTELVYETSSPQSTRAKNVVVDRSKVAVSRTILYIQGALLGIVAILFFSLGLVVGVDYGSEGGGTPDEPAPARVTGRVVYEDGNRHEPDSGAVVILIPYGSQPPEKILPDNLRPDDEPPADDHVGLSIIEDLNGAYCRTDQDGKFSATVLSRKRYYVLYISHHAIRSQNEVIPNDTSRLQMGTYFVQIPELLGNNEYKWDVRDIYGNKELPEVMFQ